MKKCSDFTPFQWELAITASRFELGLLTNDEIIAFTHKLMDKGFYDDVMIDIIDVKPFNEIKDNFKNLINKWNLPKINHNDSRYFNTLYLIYPFTIHPLNLNYFDKDNLFYWEYYLSKEYADNAVFDFLIECENWLNRNKNKILEIMNQLFNGKKW